MEIKRNKGQVFCSTVCHGLSCRKETPCLICGKPIRAGLNKKTCSRSCANKHREGIRYKMNRSKDKAKSQRSLKIKLLQARGSSCERCGFNKYQILQIHHKDKNRNNNKLDNLMIVCKSCHAKYDNAQTNFKNYRENISDEHRKKLKEAALKDWTKRKNLIN